MEQDKEYTVVCFRTFNDATRDVIAILPEHESAKVGHCGSYMHVGQHSDCDPFGLIHGLTRPATAEESAALQRELEGIGYRLRIVKRIHRSHYWWLK